MDYDNYEPVYQNENFKVYYLGEIFIKDLSERIAERNHYGAIDNWGRTFNDTNKKRLIKRIKDYHKKILNHKGTLEKV